MSKSPHKITSISLSSFLASESNELNSETDDDFQEDNEKIGCLPNLDIKTSNKNIGLKLKKTKSVSFADSVGQNLTQVKLIKGRKEPETFFFDDPSTSQYARCANA